ncbi:hypothetical protein LSH36_184g07027 [Paralvinella palmiformis]|uniref:Semaphorin-1A n=1 Tax=Paralvinella palmiformis TaxID=53620 RepID=A0AAD9N6Z5_9ANNE|nr:hypothetical protein LSH36_184g07027 [Paralvinella palmiformis]
MLVRNGIRNIESSGAGAVINRVLFARRVPEDQVGAENRILPDQCDNYIRVISQKSDDKILICGTNAYKPWCRTYAETEDGYKMMDDATGIGLCPFDHRHNSTAVYADGQLFAGTVADVSARDALVYRRSIRTEQHDSQWLNDPDFVSSFEYEDKIYFFFRETAIEYINCGKAVYSRVGRVCKNDQGGMMMLKNTWTSFFKSRLNCSIPGEFPFYFNEIQSTSSMNKGHYRSTLLVDDTQDMIYAVFTTPRNSISGSAVCAFRMKDIIETFEGQFKEQKLAHSNWMPVKNAYTPQCHNNTKEIPDSTLLFVWKHPLMDKAVPAFGGQPILVQASFSFRMTVIEVDWQYRAVDARRYDILYIGTDDGRVIKAVNKKRSDQIETVIIEDLVVFEDKSPITKLALYRHSGVRQAEHLIVVTENEIRKLPLHRCHLHKDCSSCIALQDPYCSWDSNKFRCVNLVSNVENRYFYQSIETGKHSQCEGRPATTSTRKVSSTTLASTASSTVPVTCQPCAPTPREDTPQAGPLSTVVPTPEVESRLTLPQIDQDEKHEMNNKIPVIPREAEEAKLGASVGGISSCSAEKLAIAVVIPSLVFGIAGFFIGYLVSSRCVPSKSTGKHYKDGHHTKAENTYSQDPAKAYVTSPPFPSGKVKIYHNPTKQCNIKVPNGSVEAIIETHKDNKVYV